MRLLSLTPALLALLPYVSAHGYLASVTIDGTEHKGNAPNGKANASPIRQIDDISPVKGADNANINCGQKAQKASQVANAKSGSKMEFQWSGGQPGEKWPHNTGPLMTYMALCEGTTCDKFDSADANWFKIDQVGKQDNGDWFQQNIMNGDSVFVTLPDNLAPGDYLVRHEIIALHLANSLGGAEFYPACTQVRIAGSGSGTPDSTVKFPGAYNDNDPGIFDKNIFDTGDKYDFPGPKISNLFSASDDAGTNTGSGSGSSGNSTSGGSGNSSGGGDGPTSTKSGHHSSSAAPSASASPISGASTPPKSCKLKKRDQSGSQSSVFSRRARRDVAGRLRHSVSGGSSV